MRKALLVGINAYSQNALQGCVNDVRNLEAMLASHGDAAASPNFDCKQVIADTPADDPITCERLRSELKSLFEYEADTSLFYFSGHGFRSKSGGDLVTQDFGEGGMGVPMEEVLNLANEALLRRRAKEVVLILDCCYSGNLGGVEKLQVNSALMAEGLTILAAARGYAPSFEAGQSRGGIFTNLLCGALEGGAANVLGVITLASVYSFVESQLGAWDQRPLFKCHVASSSVLRRVAPLIDLAILKKVRQYFETADFVYPLDPTYDEDKHDAPEDQREVNQEHEEIMAHFRQYAAKGLLVPVGAEYLYWAAVRSQSCKLTASGKYIWELVEGKRI
jgi:hypothetical protein